jgi:hypothetical protein
MIEVCCDWMNPGKNSDLLKLLMENREKHPPKITCSMVKNRETS